MLSNTASFAKQELDILVKSAPDPDNRPIIEEFIPEIIALVDRFGKSGQSGGSAPYTANAISQAIKKLCLHEPICPITGVDDEWMDIDSNPKSQNRRCSALFKDADNKAYYIDAIIWKTEKGHCFSGSAFLNGVKYLSRQYVKSFPFTPKTFYIDVTEKEIAPNDWEFTITQPRQLAKVFKYYDRFTI